MVDSAVKSLTIVKCTNKSFNASFLDVLRFSLATLQDVAVASLLVLLCNAELAELLVIHRAETTACTGKETLYQRYICYLKNTEVLDLKRFKRPIRIFHVLFNHGGMDVKATFEAEMDVFNGLKQKRRYSILRIIRMLFLERHASPSTEGLMPQAWMRKIVLDDEASDVAKALESSAVARGAKDREWHDDELVFHQSPSRLKLDLSKFKDVWKRKSV